VIDVTDRSNIDVRLAALKDCRIAAQELLLASLAQSGLKWVLARAQSAGCPKKGANERHGCEEMCGTTV
jgi:hypothetical protein